MADFDIYSDLCDAKVCTTPDSTALQPARTTLPALTGAQAPNLAELPKRPLHSPAEACALQRSFSTEETRALETGGTHADGEDSKNSHKNDVQEWSAPGWEAWNFNDGFAVEAGEVVKPKNPAPEKPLDFDALQKELLADEESAVPCRGDPKVTEVANEDLASGSDTEAESEAAGGTNEDVDGPLIQLDEIRASERQPLIVEAWSRGPRSRAANTVASGTESANGGSSRRLRRKEVSLFMGPPPPVPQTMGGGNPAERLVLVGGIPWWLSDAELRRPAEQFGQLRSIRILESERSGKSVGIALLEYTAMEAAQRAANPAEGFCTLSLWATLEEAKPRAVLVSQELFGKLRSGSLPWPDGGSCAEDLRTIMLRQFDMSHSSALIRRNSGSVVGSPVSGVQRRNSNSGGRASPDAERPGKEEGWAEKLKKLQSNVNRRQMEPVDALTDGVLRKRRR
mmetsp:Transcript_4387/g.8785  ORF Transcript_4387/g.8785 Transcript_4387/m.8785 type:complete len:454 (-) Transcript_4387:16-1377(-)